MGCVQKHVAETSDYLIYVKNCRFRIPFYYEIKILFVIWLLSPATRGSSILYRKFVHPQLMKRERVCK
jgi:hypothetical protein